KADPDAVTVFIGPCLAKRREGMDDEFVDYVLSVEEIGAFLIAKDVDVTKVAAAPDATVPSASGRGFAASGGVAEAVRIRLKHPEKLRVAVINGLTGNGMKQLATFGKMNAGTLPYTDQSPNLVEVMACEGGCIAGPSVITNPKVANMQLKKYMEAGVSNPAN
ncbi:MAG: Fe-hydrogenase large subunit family protein, partial [Spirochaetaceae bacterium]|nr:Fe-hydrogenase large subunit family protein [Spirochaetaceae bacterium]